MDTPLRVLIVEDAIADTQLILDVLRNGGYEPIWERVETEATMAAALDAQTWDVVLTNAILPQLSAFAALHLLQVRGIDLPLFVVAAHIDDAMATAMIKAGARESIKKEQLGSLVPAIQRALHSVRERRGKKPVEPCPEVLPTIPKSPVLHDDLTGLPNRALLDNELSAVVLIAQEKRKPFSLLYLDLDHFQRINDTFGYRWGDDLLRQVTPRLQGILRKSDTIARMNGDEFAILLPTVGEANGAVRLARRLLHVLEAPFQIEGHHVSLSANIGIGLCPDHGTDADTLLRRAALAVHMAKRTGVGYALYTAELEEGCTPSRILLLNELRHAAAQEQLRLFYQPKVEMASGKIQQVEALLRWHHPQMGILPPAQFLPVAEEAGFMKPLSQWVLNEAIRQCRAWKSDGIKLQVAVNLSMRDLQDTHLPESIADMLTTWGLEPEALEVEVTETAIASDINKTRQTLADLHSVGVHIAIDDFGTGYSSLARLQALPVDTIKIDKSFMLELVEKENARAIVRATIELGHNLGLRVVAEGVEDQATWDVLSSLGCDLVQGYLISHPLPAEDFQRWFDRAVGADVPWSGNVDALKVR